MVAVLSTTTPRNSGGLISEVTCPVCLGLYQDPVRLPCEHNLCRACLGECEPGLGECELDLGECEPDLGECEPDLGECELDLGECEPDLGECEPGLGEYEPGLGECEPGLGECEPRLGECEPGLGLGAEPETAAGSQARDSGPSLRCPQCLKTMSRFQVKSNQLLANIVERVRRLRVDELPLGTMCPNHHETLKLYCTEDHKPICVVCGVSREHRDHSIIPIHEASQLCQVSSLPLHWSIHTPRSGLETE
uniref:Uncharacterized protein n=1 Tax=Callorhinchus milii TaxID=7868 RepID=A0A4W3HNG1_CALMI